MSNSIFNINGREMKFLTNSEKWGEDYIHKDRLMLPLLFSKNKQKTAVMIIPYLKKKILQALLLNIFYKKLKAVVLIAEKRRMVLTLYIIN